jgi:molybdopterin synthase catalytic subunit
MMRPFEVRLRTDRLDCPAPLFSTTQGALVDFFGVVRALENNCTIEGIDYEAFVPMAEQELAKLADAAQGEFRLGSVMIHHRLGFVPVGEASLFVRVTSCHRQSAFEAMEWIVERLKQVVPIWKHPVYAASGVA